MCIGDGSYENKIADESQGGKGFDRKPRPECHHEIRMCCHDHGPLHDEIDQYGNKGHKQQTGPDKGQEAVEYPCHIEEEDQARHYQRKPGKFVYETAVHVLNMNMMIMQIKAICRA